METHKPLRKSDVSQLLASLFQVAGYSSAAQMGQNKGYHQEGLGQIGACACCASGSDNGL